MSSTQAHIMSSTQAHIMSSTQAQIMSSTQAQIMSSTQAQIMSSTQAHIMSSTQAQTTCPIPLKFDTCYRVRSYIHTCVIELEQHLKVVIGDCFYSPKAFKCNNSKILVRLLYNFRMGGSILNNMNKSVIGYISPHCPLPMTRNHLIVYLQWLDITSWSTAND